MGNRQAIYASSPLSLVTYRWYHQSSMPTILAVATKRCQCNINPDSRYFREREREASIMLKRPQMSRLSVCDRKVILKRLGYMGLVEATQIRSAKIKLFVPFYTELIDGIWAYMVKQIKHSNPSSKLNP